MEQSNSFFGTQKVSRLLLRLAPPVMLAQNNTTNTFRGGFNQTESELNLKKYVYDFAISQANGTISSVCLTHPNGGYTGYGSKNAVYTNSYPLVQSICEDTGTLIPPTLT